MIAGGPAGSSGGMQGTLAKYHVWQLWPRQLKQLLLPSASCRRRKKPPKTTTGSASLHFGRICCKCNSLYLLSQCSKIQNDNDSLKKLYNVHFPPRLLQRFMTEFAAQQQKLGRRPCNQNGFFLYAYIYFLPCYIFTLVWTQGYFRAQCIKKAHNPPQHTHLETSKEVKNTFHLFLCLLQRQYTNPAVCTEVGCCSDKLAWIKCQPWSRSTLAAACANPLVWGGEVRQSGAVSILAT